MSSNAMGKSANCDTSAGNAANGASVPRTTQTSPSPGR
jgi:hypothetical protein